ncbi:MAG: phospholipase A [Oleibacter sp.]|nr:phospholipase A [Thalassolituus sp.]
MLRSYSGDKAVHRHFLERQLSKFVLSVFSISAAIVVVQSAHADTIQMIPGKVRLAEVDSNAVSLAAEEDVSIVSTGQPSADISTSNPSQTNSETEKQVTENPKDIAKKPKTEEVEVEVLDKNELGIQVQQVPELVEKIRTERIAASNPYVLLPHKPNFLLPITYQTRPDNKELLRALRRTNVDPDDENYSYQHIEAVMQFSAKTIIAEDVLGKLSTIEFAYTNKSYWQVYNGTISKPFRETNHEPELIFTWRLKDYWLDRFALSLNHQSNGQTIPLSRSWNRIIADMTKVNNGNVWNLRTWYRIPEEQKSSPIDPGGDDNPDILEFMGYGELTYIHVMAKHQFSVMVRDNLQANENRGAIELGYSFPLTKKLKGYAQYFNGYGESLIDYNRYQERFGIGIKLSDWF